MKQKVCGLLGLAMLLSSLTACDFPRGKTADGEYSFTAILYKWSNDQKETSDEVFDQAMPDSLEENVTGGKVEDGSNWSIPNILRNLIGA